MFDSSFVPFFAFILAVMFGLFDFLVQTT